MLKVTEGAAEGGCLSAKGSGAAASLESLVEPMSIQMDTCQAMRVATKSY